MRITGAKIITKVRFVARMDEGIKRRENTKNIHLRTYKYIAGKSLVMDQSERKCMERI